MSTPDEVPPKKQYELPTGAVTILDEILPTPQWYKDDPKYAKLLCNAKDALDALPETKPRPDPKPDETRAAFEKRVDPWSSEILMFEWTDKQKDAAKKCVQFYLKAGNLGGAAAPTIALIKLFGLQHDD